MSGDSMRRHPPDASSVRTGYLINKMDLTTARSVQSVLPGLAAQARRSIVSAPKLKAKRGRKAPEPWEFTDQNTEG